MLLISGYLAIDSILFDNIENFFKMTQEPIYNIDELIIRLKKIRNKVGDNAEVFTYCNDEYSRISNIKIDEEEDIIIETHTVW